VACDQPNADVEIKNQSQRQSQAKEKRGQKPRRRRRRHHLVFLLSLPAAFATRRPRFGWKSQKTAFALPAAAAVVVPYRTIDSIHNPSVAIAIEQ